MAATAKTATYKGRTYTLLFLGDTKFGRRAKLAFRDGSKEFWVPAAAVTVSATAPAARDRNRWENECEVCGRNRYTCGHCVGW